MTDEAVVKAQVESTYNRWHTALYDALVGSGDPVALLKPYAAEPLLTTVADGIRSQRSQGIRLTGRRRTSTGHVTSLNLDANPPTATIDGCIDTTGSEAVDASGKSVEAADRLLRYRSIAQARRQPDGHWVFTTEDANPEEPCTTGSPS